MKHMKGLCWIKTFILWSAALLATPMLPITGLASGQTTSLTIAQETLQDLRIGQFYPAGLRVRSPQLGISFVVPQDWRVRLSPGAGVIHMDSARKEGIGIIHLLEDVSTEDIEARLNEPQSFEAAFVLDPATPVVSRENHLSSTYQHGDQIGLATAVLGPGSQAVVYLMAGPITEQKHFADLLRQLSHSTHFLQPAQASSLKTWYQRLNGQELTGLPDIPNTKDHRWHFCGTGRFVHEYHPAAPGGKTPEENGFEEAGPWHIDIQDRKVLLVVTPDHSLARTFALDMNDQHITLNSDKYRTRRSHTCF